MSATLRPALSFGYSASRREATVFRRLPLAAWLMPGLRRPNNVHGEEAAIVEEFGVEAGEDLILHADWQPGLLGVGDGDGAFEAARRDADDGVRGGVEDHAAADDVGIGAEFVGPERVTDDRDGVAVGLGVFVREEESGRQRE